MPSVYSGQLGDKRIYGQPLPRHRKKLPEPRGRTDYLGPRASTQPAPQVKTRDREEAHIWKQYVMLHAPPPQPTEEEKQCQREHLQVQLYLKRDAPAFDASTLGAAAAAAPTAAPAPLPPYDGLSRGSVTGSFHTGLDTNLSFETAAGITRLGTLLIHSTTTLRQLRDIASRQYSRKCPIAFNFGVTRRSKTGAGDDAPEEAPAPENPEAPSPRTVAQVVPFIGELQIIPFDDEEGAKVIDTADPVALSAEDAAPLVEHFRMVLVIPAPEDLSVTDNGLTMNELLFG